jgi:hypothetical protein
MPSEAKHLKGCFLPIPPCISLPSLRPQPLTPPSQHTGTGKSTLSHALTTTIPNATRLSIDALIHANHGLYGIDYPPSAYQTHQASAAALFEDRLRDLLSPAPRKSDEGEEGKSKEGEAKGKGDKEGGAIILDRAFYARADRDRFRAIIEDGGARCVLVYLRPARGREWLWERIQRRWAGRVEVKGEGRGDVSLEIHREVFDGWWDGFEVPLGEWEVVLEV